VKKSLLFFSVAVALMGVMMSLASKAGVCFEKRTLLNDSEYFKGAIDVVLHDPVDGVVEEFSGGTVARSIHSQKYSSPEKFLTEFPHCCTFVSPNSGDGDGLDVGLLERIVGVRVVAVSYTKRYSDDGSQKTSKATAKVAVTSCGKGLPFR
jgi:hypothetical protein